MVVSAIADRRHAAERVVIATELIVRGSTGPVADAA
jgi:hypothetical protein